MMKNNFLKTFFLLTLFLCGVKLSAQPPLKARPLNVFTLPGQAVTVNVLDKSELGACGVAATGVIRLNAAEAPGTLQHGTAAVDIDNNIVYTPSSSAFQGQDSLKYVLTCGAKRDTAVILINMDDKPEVIKDACAIDPEPMVWGIRDAADLGAIFNYSPLLAGDLDGNGIPEIVICPQQVTGSSSSSYGGSQLSIFMDGGTGPRIDFTTVKPYQCFMPGMMALARVKVFETKSISLIIMAENDQVLRAYKLTEPGDTYPLTDDPRVSLVWESSSSIPGQDNKWSPVISVSIGTSVAVADFNQDGYAEVYSGNKIFDAATGALLCAGSGNRGFTSNSGSTTDVMMSRAADIFGDSKLELVTGNQVYAVDIDRDRDPALNSMTVIKQVTPPGSYPADGLTQVVDIDNDGSPEILVEKRISTNLYLIYLWSPVTQSILAYRTFTNVSVMGIPFIGDIDGDGYNEIVFIVSNYGGSPNTAAEQLIYALKYNQGASSLDIFWKMYHTDNSGWTGMTLFDFNQDGIGEMVYRDETVLRIMNVSGKDAVGNNMIDADGNLDIGAATLKSYSNTSGTGYEYPIVADVDLDGEAEIIIGGSNRLHVYKSDGTPWAPARPVWNQYAYNPVYVNDDLTIPAYPLNPVTKFVTKDGSFHQPFNNFMQQATLLNEDGELLRYGPRLTFDNLSSDPVTFTYPGAYGANSIDVSFSVSNIGDAAFPDPLDISAYLLQGGNFVYLGTHAEPGVIPAGTSVNIAYTIDFSAAGVSGDQRDFIQLRLNDRGVGIGRDADSGLPQECNYSGHFSRDLFGAPDYPLCANEESVIYFYPQNNPSYSYVWYDTDPDVGTPTPVHEGESYTFVKSPAEASEVFYVDVWEAETGLKVGDTYTVKTFLVPDTLVWTAGGRNNDWNDPDNWFYPGGPDYSTLGTDVKYKVPGSCTNVEIPSPGLLSNPWYPDLKEGETAYPGPYTGARCNRIWYRSGGETARTDSLHYNLAYVDLTLDTHRWYMISAPLKSMYTGDYYIREQNPYRDERMYEPMFFNVTNPQTMETPVVAWTGRFHNADLLLAAGQGMAIWYDKTDEGYTYHDPVTSSFPKPDIYYGYYAPDGHAEYYTGLLNRDGCNRFIYEPPASDGTVPLSLGGQPGTKDVPLLTGNPFMSHLDMERFLSDNDSQLYGGYKLASGVAPVDGKMNNFISYQRSGESWFSTDPDVQDLDAARYVAPMQSFIVVPKTDNPDIRAHVEAMTTLPSGALRSGEPAPDGIKVLGILAVRGEERSKALVLYPDDASDAFDPGEDSYRLFPDDNEIPLLVYTRSADGYALDINSMKTFETRVPLGIRSSLPGTVTLIFTETAALGESATVYLYDMKEDRYLNLSEQNEYTFTKQPEDPLYLEDRFRLYLEPKAMGLSDVYSSLSVTSSVGSVEIVSEDGSPLRNIRITDVQGRILSEESNFMQSRYRFRTPGAGLYIVRAANEHSAVTKKIMVR